MVEVLRAVRTKPCADVLFAELRRVKSWNTMRRHLAAVIKVLESLPAEVIQDGFAELAANKSFSRYMRDKFGAVMASADSPDDEWCGRIRAHGGFPCPKRRDSRCRNAQV